MTGLTKPCPDCAVYEDMDEDCEPLPPIDSDDK